MLLVAAVAGPGVGPAAATHDCSTTDAAVFGFSFGFVNQDKCTNNHVYHAVQEVRDAETAQDKVDLYSAASGQKAQAENYNVLYDNYLQDTDTTAWSKAETAIAQAHKNGSTKAEAKAEAKKAIENYYAVKQKNLIKSWNTSVTAYQYTYERADQESFTAFDTEDNADGWTTGHNAGFVGFIGEDHPSDSGSTEGRYDDTATKTQYDGTRNSSVTLVNSTSAGALEVGAGHVPGGDAYSYKTNWVSPTTGSTIVEPSGWTDSYYKAWQWHGLTVNAPNDNYDQIEYLRFSDYSQRWSEIETKNTELQNESDAFVESIWDDLGAGNINNTDVISRNTLMFEYGTAVQSNNSTYYDSIGAAASMGLSSPDLNSTGQMTITTHDNGNSHDGMIFGTPPNATWDVGTEYDAGEISSPVFVATTDGQFFEVTGNFTVTEATDKSGQSQTEVATKEYNYQTANTNELNQQMTDLLTLTEELQERSDSVATEPAPGGAGGFLPDLGGSSGMLLLVGAGAAAVLALRGDG